MGQSCRTCKFLDVAPNAAGKVVARKHEAYRCLAPDPEWPALPDSITRHYGYKPTFHRRYMQPDEGDDCPLYRLREKQN